MWENIRYFDIYLFNSINHLPHNGVSDSFFAFFSGLSYWRIVWFAAWIFVLLYKIGKDKIEYTALLLSGIGTFLFVSLGLKNIIHRPRPELIIPHVMVIWDLSDSWSFPSTHATMAFALAYILSVRYPRWKYVSYIGSILIAFSRIYLGKHYPSDVIIGAFVGSMIGWGAWNVSNLLFGKRTNRLKKK